MRQATTLILLVLSPWLWQELALAHLLWQPGWRTLLSYEDHWGTTRQGPDWTACRSGGSGGELYTLEAGGLKWNTCYEVGDLILKIDDHEESPRFLVYQPLSGNNNIHFMEHPEELEDGFWLIQKRDGRYQRQPILTHPFGLLIRQLLK